MKLIQNAILVLVVFLFVGCSSNASQQGAKNNNQNKSSQNQAYTNKNLPQIKDDSIPDILTSSHADKNNSKLFGFSASGDNKSGGYVKLKNKSLFFYQKQLEMNMGLGHIDSILGDIKSYCENNDTNCVIPPNKEVYCIIPANQITFRYTEALYLRDKNLIEHYEKKTGQKFEISTDDLKKIVGMEANLTSADFSIYKEGKYKYEIDTQWYEGESNPTLYRQAVKWSEDNSSFLVRDTAGDDGKEWSQYEYDENGSQEISRFTSNDGTSMVFTQDNEKTSFVQDEPSKDVPEMGYYAEGYLDSDGGKMTIFSGAQITYETFTADGELIDSKKCIAGDKNNVDKESCHISSADSIKKIITKKVYKMEPTVLNSHIGSVRYLSMITFDQNNTLHATVNCSNISADYSVDKHGIEFGNIKEEENSSLHCISHIAEDSFLGYLHKGVEFGEDGFIVYADLWPELTSEHNRSDYNITKFKQSQIELKYLDSYAMSHLDDVRSWNSLFNPKKNQSFYLGSDTNMTIEDDTIHIELIDAVFDAKIKIKDIEHISFEDINRTDKEGVTYPQKQECDDEGPNECHGENDSREYDDKIFANAVNDFLNSKNVKVSTQGSDGSGQLYFISPSLGFYSDVQ